MPNLACGQTVRRGATYLDQLCEMDASIMQASQLTQGFLAIIREPREDGLKAWITAATGSGLCTGPLRLWVREYPAAVSASLIRPWSNGHVEGQITRLKLLKRQSYGRAGLPLLRQRMLHAA